MSKLKLLLCFLIITNALSKEQNLTALFHEALSTDGGLQSAVGMTGELSDLELVYLRRKPSSPLPDIVFNSKTKRNHQKITLSYSFKAFGREYGLHLVPMKSLVSAKAKMVIVKDGENNILSSIPPTVCHYTHVDHRITAALDGCTPGTIAGYIVSDNITLEVRPLRGIEADYLHRVISKRSGIRFTRDETPHVVRKIVKTANPRPHPSEMELEMPPPACSEPVGNATPDDLEFGQGELLTIPPQDRQTTSSPIIDDLYFPEVITPRPAPHPQGEAVAEVVEAGDPEGIFIPPLPLFKRDFEEIPEYYVAQNQEETVDKRSEVNISNDRYPKPMPGFDREPKPIIFTTQKPSGEEDTLGKDRYPKPMPGFDREPKPIDFGKRKHLGGKGDEENAGKDRYPKPMPGFDREPKPINFDEQEHIVKKLAEENNGKDRYPKPIPGFDREPKPMVFTTQKPSGGKGDEENAGKDRYPKPMPGFDREPKPINFDEQEHIVKKLAEENNGKDRYPKPMPGFDREPKPMVFTTQKPSETDQRKLRKRNAGDKTIELGVFMDQAAYDLFFPYLGSQKALTDVILGYVNGIQALFHHPTLGQKIRLIINYVEVMSKQPASLPHFGGDREKLYESFRLYNEKKNEEETNKVDGNPWDMGILISGLNFYSVNKADGRTTYSTMGLAAVRGVCHPGYSAVIVELGATDTWGKPYPSAGFASVYVMAHEMGHNLGMLHDGYGNSCPKNGYVMSASRSTSGETNWSSCSREIIETMTAPCLTDTPSEVTLHDHSIYEQFPGQTWDAYDQCRMFLRDNDATLYNETIGENVCDTVMCRSPHRIGYFKAGPALDGTYCGDKNWCIAGTCTPWPADRTPKVVIGGWSEWEHTTCSSGCIEGGKGVQVSKRTCNNPKPQNTGEICPGLDTRLNVCDDSVVCGSSRVSVHFYADEKCKEFSQVVEDIKPIGAQAPHHEDRKWQACAIFCQKASGTWYSPRTDLSHLPHFDTYFPDGTACHTDGDIQYYCQRHQCLPRGERQAKGLNVPAPEWGVHVYQNAPPRPSNNTVPEQVAKIFELSQNMDPLEREPLDLYHEDDEDLWIDDDYYHPINSENHATK